MTACSTDWLAVGLLTNLPLDLTLLSWKVLESVTTAKTLKESGIGPRERTQWIKKNIYFRATIHE